MPVRFVEVTNPLEVARKSSQLSWDNFNISSFLPIRNATNSTLSRVGTAASNIRRPGGLAQACLLVGFSLYALHFLLLHWVAKRQVALHGHAHRE